MSALQFVVPSLSPAALLFLQLLLKADLILPLGKGGATFGLCSFGAIPGCEHSDHVMSERGKSLFFWVFIDFEENVGDVLVDVVDECLLATGVRVDELSHVDHSFLVKDHVTMLLLRPLDPLLRRTVHILYSPKDTYRPFTPNNTPNCTSFVK